MKCSSTELRSGEWLGHCRIFPFFIFKNSWVAFAVRFGSPLDTVDYANYRPISNLPFVSKIMEKVVATQLQSFLALWYISVRFSFTTQYWNCFSISGVSGNLSIVLLLDLNSAFDTVSHNLYSEIGISGAALAWFSSYLTDRQYYITMHNYKSPTAPLKQGVPQGSVEGPLLCFPPIVMRMPSN